MKIVKKVVKAAVVVTVSASLFLGAKLLSEEYINYRDSKIKQHFVEATYQGEGKYKVSSEKEEYTFVDRIVGELNEDELGQEYGFVLKQINGDSTYIAFVTETPKSDGIGAPMYTAISSEYLIDDVLNLVEKSEYAEEETAFVNFKANKYSKKFFDKCRIKFLRMYNVANK